MFDDEFKQALAHAMEGVKITREFHTEYLHMIVCMCLYDRGLEDTEINGGRPEDLPAHMSWPSERWCGYAHRVRTARSEEAEAELLALLKEIGVVQ